MQITAGLRSSIYFFFELCVLNINAYLHPCFEYLYTYTHERVAYQSRGRFFWFEGNQWPQLVCTRSEVNIFKDNRCKRDRTTIMYTSLNANTQEVLLCLRTFKRTSRYILEILMGYKYIRFTTVRIVFDNSGSYRFHKIRIHFVFKWSVSNSCVHWIRWYCHNNNF